MSKLITNTIRHTGGSADNITLDNSQNVTVENNLQVDGNVTVTGTIPADKLTGNLPAISGASLTGIPTRTQPFRNLIINGAMQVAQRLDGSVTANGYKTVDRWNLGSGGTDEVPTQKPTSLGSSDTGPFEEGFRTAYQIKNGNQTSGAGATDFCQILYKPEGQDIHGSGWDYTNPNSKVTLSYWVRSSVAQNFYGFIEAGGPVRIFGWETGALTANTWKKVTVTIPGYASLAIPNTTAAAFTIAFIPFYGTGYTHASNRTVGSWYEAYNYIPDMTSTWWTTDDATFEITGVQLETGSVATDFEHRSYGDDLERCKRYCQVLKAGGAYTRFSLGYAPGSTDVRWFNDLRPEMRDTPSFAHSGSFVCQPGSSFDIGDVSLESSSSSPQMAILNTSGNSGMTAGEAVSLHANNDATAKITFSAEL